MYLRFYRFFPSFKPSSPDSDSDDTSSPSTLSLSSPSISDSNISPSTRSRIPFLSHLQSKEQQNQHQHQQQQQKQVHWGPITEIPPIKREPEVRPHPLRGNPLSRPKPKHSNSKPIRKPPTPLDQEIFHRNLWEMIHQAEAKIRLNYEYLSLSGEGERDHRVLDAWFKIEEQAMHKGVNRAAKAQVQALVQAQARPKIAKRKKKTKRVRVCSARGVLESEKEGELLGDAEAALKSMKMGEGIEKAVKGCLSFWSYGFV
ncbi:hypothetical protein SI65_01219 [Aspergillus cristatus]|uniref:Uncharacterized protein n=1 Tax=Aspergillus cristatus TaxID=573508 RepID=A0A1E3BRP4_ASPCR|nr:hypothetical protein SI65_01219 [Aspergillus cristatus]